MKNKKREEKKEHEALTELKKKYGDDILTCADEGYPPIEAISTGCLAFDRVLGCGGLPRGRILELYGEPSSGKTSACLYLISQIQKTGGKCAFIDAEYAFSTDFAKAVGVNTSALFVSQPDNLEVAMDTLRAIVATNQFDLVVVDSVAAMVPKREIEGEEMLANSMAVTAQLMAKALRILTGEAARSKTSIIFINHLREKIGLVFGEKKYTPGGKSLHFFSSIRLAVAKGDKIKGDKGEQIGNIIKITAQKNKVAPPWRTGEFTLYYKSGIDLHADTFDVGLEFGVITKEGNTYKFNEDIIGVGRDKAIEVLRGSPELYQKIHRETQLKIKE